MQTRCDISSAHVITDEYVDGKTKMGPWATMCPACHYRLGLGLGRGKGQRYNLVKGEWTKVEG